MSVLYSYTDSSDFHTPVFNRHRSLHHEERILLLTPFIIIVFSKSPYTAAQFGYSAIGKNISYRHYQRTLNLAALNRERESNVKLGLCRCLPTADGYPIEA